MPVRTKLDAAVVGAGPDGLAAAITLAQAGLSVRLIEQREAIGGGVSSAELTLPASRTTGSLATSDQRLLSDVLAPMHWPVHPGLLARFGCAWRPARAVAEPSFRETRTRALFGGMAMHGTQPLEAHDPNYIGGDIAGGATNLRQLLARPWLQRRRDATGIAHVYLCSASTPPAGGAAAGIRALRPADPRRCRVTQKPRRLRR